MNHFSQWLRRHLQRITTSTAYLPEVDGLRFIAIMAVVVHHLVDYLEVYFHKTSPHPEIYFSVMSFARYGFFGVQLFFVISGFIISLPFVRFYGGQGRPVSLARYYLRRVTRLEPPFFAAMTLCYLGLCVTSGASAGRPPFGDYLLTIFYLYGPVLHHTSSICGVTWSLEVEVQFYILAPMLLAVFQLKPWFRRSLLLIAISVFSYWAVVGGKPLTQFCFVTYLQYFLAGFLLADFYVERQAADQRGGSDGRALMLLGWIVLIVGGTLLVAGFEWFELYSPLLVGSFYFCVFFSPFWKQLFSVPLAAAVGGMCYSIYLLHYPTISTVGRLLRMLGGTHIAGWVLYFYSGLLILASLAVSTLFYLLLERPCMDPKWPVKLWRWLCRRLALQTG